MSIDLRDVGGGEMQTIDCRKCELADDCHPGCGQFFVRGSWCVHPYMVQCGKSCGCTKEEGG